MFTRFSRPSSMTHLLQLPQDGYAKASKLWLAHAAVLCGLDLPVVVNALGFTNRKKARVRAAHVRSRQKGLRFWAHPINGTVDGPQRRDVVHAAVLLNGDIGISRAVADAWADRGILQVESTYLVDVVIAKGVAVGMRVIPNGTELGIFAAATTARTAEGGAP